MAGMVADWVGCRCIHWVRYSCCYSALGLVHAARCEDFLQECIWCKGVKAKHKGAMGVGASSVLGLEGVGNRVALATT